jgi:hypothetical protein
MNEQLTKGQSSCEVYVYDLPVMVVTFPDHNPGVKSETSSQRFRADKQRLKISLPVMLQTPKATFYVQIIFYFFYTT